MTGETDVAQLVIRRPDTGEYFLARRTSDSYWEFIGGKREKEESIEEAARRELDEELKSVAPGEAEILEIADSYPSQADSSFRLNPVLMEIPGSIADRMRTEDLSREHDSMAWIDLHDYDEYETLGQFPALEELGIVKGDVGIALPREKDEFLMIKRSAETTSSGRWNFPGGKIEKGEEPEEAALRELEEETDLVGEVLDSGDWFISSGETGYWRIFPFLVEVDSRQVELDEAHSDHIWVSPEEFSNLENFIGNFKSLEKLGLEYEPGDR